MFVDFMPLIFGVIAITTGPLVIGLILRLFGLRLAARIAAGLSIAACLAIWGLLAYSGAHGGFLVSVQLVLALALWFGSPMKRLSLTGDDPPPEADPT